MNADFLRAHKIGLFLALLIATIPVKADEASPLPQAVSPLSPNSINQPKGEIVVDRWIAWTGIGVGAGLFYFIRRNRRRRH